MRVVRLTRALAIAPAILALAFCQGAGARAQMPELPKFDRAKPARHAAPPAEVRPDPAPAAQSAGPHLLKRTVQLRPRRFLRWWKNATATEPVYDTWSWVPEIKFAVNGPVAAGSQLSVEFDKADGTPWFTQRMRTPTLDAEHWEMVEGAEGLTPGDLEKKAVTAQSGLFPFRVRLKNALEGTDTVLFSGRYKLSTYQPDPKIPEYRARKEFYFDEDWRLPMGWLWPNPVNNETAPILCLQLWFRNSETGDEIEAFLYHNGKQIAASKSGSPDEVLTNGVDEKPYRYSLRTFYFNKVRGYNRDPNPATFADSFLLDKNPGEYEIKVLRNGELARSLRFTVGPDGAMVDNGVTRQNRLGGIRMLVPVKIVGAADGKYNPSAWQTDAFYGNPLAGFTPAP